MTSVFHGAHPQSSMSLRNSRELRSTAECIDALLTGDLPHLGDLLMQRLKAVQTAVVEGNWNFAQLLELIPATGSNVVAQAEMRAAQRTQLDQARLYQGGKGSGGGPARASSQGLGPGGGKASPSPRRPLPKTDATNVRAVKAGRKGRCVACLPAGHIPKTDATNVRAVKAGRKGRWRVSHHFHTKFRTPVSVPTPKSPPPPQKARPHTPPARVPPQVQAGALRAVSRSPSVVGEARQVLPVVGPAPRSPLPNRHVALQGSKCRRANGQEDQLQKKRGTKGTSKTDTMERQEQESARASPRH